MQIEQLFSGQCTDEMLVQPRIFIDMTIKSGTRVASLYSWYTNHGQGQAAADKLHDILPELAKHLSTRAVRSSHNIIYDAILGNSGNALALMREARNANYRMHMVAVFVHPHEALERVYARSLFGATCTRRNCSGWSSQLYEKLTLVLFEMRRESPAHRYVA